MYSSRKLEILKSLLERASFLLKILFFCRGEKTMMKMWKKVEETADECLQLEPAFDIPLFEGDDGDMLDDNDINPFITSNQGFQTLVSYLKL